MSLISHCPPARMQSLPEHVRHTYSSNTQSYRCVLYNFTLETGTLGINTLPRITYLISDKPTCKLIWVLSELLGSSLAAVTSYIQHLILSRAINQTNSSQEQQMGIHLMQPRKRNKNVHSLPCPMPAHTPSPSSCPDLRLRL